MEQEENRTSFTDTGSGFEEKAREKVHSLKDDAIERGRRYLELSKVSAVEFLNDFAGAMETAASELESKGRKHTGGYFRSASEEMRQWSSALDDYGINSMARQVQSFSGRHPAMVLGGAAFAGFALTRLFRSVEIPEEKTCDRESFRAETPEADEQYPVPPTEFEPAAREQFGSESGPHS